MTLFASLNTALTGLRASMVALQTTGHNVANAATPGYTRQRVELQTQQPQDMGNYEIGRGVVLQRISRIIDEGVELRLRESTSTLSRLGVQSETLQRVETMMGALSGTDLGTMMTRLFDAIQNFANRPEDITARSQVLAHAGTVAEALNSLSVQIRQIRSDLNGEIKTSVDDVNRKTAEIASLNKQIVMAEDGGVHGQTASDLRDRRDLLLRGLSELMNVASVETSEGQMNVMVGSAFVVLGSESYALETTDGVDGGVTVSMIGFANGTAGLTITDGRIRGLLDSRDDVLKSVLNDLDVLAYSLAYEFNRVQSSGQGLDRFSDLTGANSVQDPTAVLAVEGTTTSRSTTGTLTDSSMIGAADPTGRTVEVLSGDNMLETREITFFDGATGTIFFDHPLSQAVSPGTRYQIKELPFPIVNGGFNVVITNEATGTEQSFAITVDLDRVGADATFNDVIAQIDALPDVAATLTAENKIRLRSGSAEIRFSFSGDTSGFLAAAGLNAFFSGSRSADLAVLPDLVGNPRLLSGAQSNAAGDNRNAQAFAALRDLAAVKGVSTFEDFFQDIAGRVGVDAAEFQDLVDNQGLVTEQLENQRQRLSGVNLDEEAVDMIQYQRIFQASARFINVIDELLNTLINSV